LNKELGSGGADWKSPLIYVFQLTTEMQDLFLRSFSSFALLPYTTTFN